VLDAVNGIAEDLEKIIEKTIRPKDPKTGKTLPMGTMGVDISMDLTSASYMFGALTVAQIVAGVVLKKIG